MRIYEKENELRINIISEHVDDIIIKKDDEGRSVICVDGDELIPGSGSGDGSGTTNYNYLSNKPYINNVKLQGNLTLSDLGITNFSGNYNDLTNKPTIPTVPTNISSFTNDSGYLTTHQDISGKQDSLVSGANIKTINNQSILGSGNITITSTGGGHTDEEINTLIANYITNNITNAENISF